MRVLTEARGVCTSICTLVSRRSFEQSIMLFVVWELCRCNIAIKMAFMFTDHENLTFERVTILLK
jgi:hypothetical protein